MTEIAHNRWLDIVPVQRLEHDLNCMMAEAPTDDQRAAITDALAAVRKLMTVIRETEQT